MFKKALCFLMVSALTLGPIIAQNYTEFTTPESFFGFKPGADRELFNYGPLIDYLKKLDAESGRLKMIEIGTSPMGRKMYAAFLSSEKNISNLDRLQKINKSLALDYGLDETAVKSLVDEGKVFVMAALSMHSTEVAPSQSAPLIAYKIATTKDPQLLGWLDNVVYMIIPCHNPDGMDMVVDNYKKYKGTQYEGSSLPRVYHKYIGHDNNRDFVTLTQEDNRVIAELYGKTWFPQVMVEKHQMGSTGPRYFVPPMHDPIAENVDEQIWNWTWIFGSNMSKDMSKQGLAGVSQHYIFDDYWPGSTETAIWKNVIGFLTEAASAQTATPIYVEPNELQVGGKGLGEYKKSINMPFPWTGGWWRLGDIVEYELATTWSIIKTASLHRVDILQFRNDLVKKEVKNGETKPPYFFVFPAKQKDLGELMGFLELMNEHGVRVDVTTEEIIYKGQVIAKGDYVISLAQPYRAFIKEVLEKQKFPERHYTPGGELIEPYDITSWSLPLHRGLAHLQIEEPNEKLSKQVHTLSFPLDKPTGIPADRKLVIFPADRNESYQAVFMALAQGVKVKRTDKGHFIVVADAKNEDKLNGIIKSLKADPFYHSTDIKIDGKDLTMPKIGLIETIFHDMDAGWTRYILDSYKIPFTVLKPQDIKEKKISDYQVLIIPGSDKDVLLSGKRKSSDGTYNIPSYPPDLVKGMEAEGLNKLMKFINEGGVVLSWGESTELFMGPQKIDKEEFEFPVSDLSKAIAKTGLQIPGSLLNVNLSVNHPLCFGMPAQTRVFSRGTPVFSTSVPYFDTDRRVVGTYPEDDILASGYAKGEEALANKSVLVWLKKGKGQLVLYGFQPQFRASTTGTYKLLFNGLLLNQ